MTFMNSIDECSRQERREEVLLSRPRLGMLAYVMRGRAARRFPFPVLAAATALRTRNPSDAWLLRRCRVDIRTIDAALLPRTAGIVYDSTRNALVGAEIRVIK